MGSWCKNTSKPNANVVIMLLFFLIKATLYFFLCGKPQLTVLMHSWWRMTGVLSGVLSDHGTLMATYPWLSKSESTERCTCLCAKCKAFYPQPQVRFYFVLRSPSSYWTAHLFTSTEYLCRCSRGPSLILVSKHFQHTCCFLFIQPEAGCGHLDHARKHNAY